MSQLRRRTWLGHIRNDDSIANQYYSGHQRAIEKGGGQRTIGGESWKNKWGQRASSVATWKMETAAQDRARWPMLHWERQGISQVEQVKLARPSDALNCVVYCD